MKPSLCHISLVRLGTHLIPPATETFAYNLCIYILNYTFSFAFRYSFQKRTIEFKKNRNYKNSMQMKTDQGPFKFQDLPPPLPRLSFQT